MEYIYPNELQHHGILGQKWGVRRYQNKDGTLTEKGKKRNKTIKKIAITGAIGVGVGVGGYLLSNKIKDTAAKKIWKLGSSEAIKKFELERRAIKLGDLERNNLEVKNNFYDIAKNFRSDAMSTLDLTINTKHNVEKSLYKSSKWLINNTFRK